MVQQRGSASCRTSPSEETQEPHLATLLSSSSIHREAWMSCRVTKHVWPEDKRLLGKRVEESWH